MPEGDTVATHAIQLRETMLGQRLTRVAGTHPSVRREARRIAGTNVQAIGTVGKHLLIDFTGGFTLHVHLGMTGFWRFGEASGPRSDGPARVVMETERRSARCFQAPTVHLGRTPRIWDAVRHLGPDLLDDPPRFDEMVTRARSVDQARTISEILLDQRAAAGIGNVYRNEVLFEAGIHPEHPVGALEDAQLLWLYKRAAAQLKRNVGTHARTTTGTRHTGAESFVYGRHRKPCRSCGTQIQIGSSTDQDRVTYWCPTCQPEP